MTITCHFCNDRNRKQTLINYDVRHYAHPDCLLKHKGAVAFAHLSLRQLERFPAAVASQFALLEELQKCIKEKHASS